MKLLKTAYLCVCFAAASFASTALSVEVGGRFIYKMPAGELVLRDATLDVPPRGQGKVVLKYSLGSIESDKFRHKTVNNRTVFQVLFMNPPGAPANSAMVLSGTYMRGTNGVIYFGDVYGKVLSDDSDHLKTLQAFDALAAHHEGWNHAGGFEFNNLAK